MNVGEGKPPLPLVPYPGCWQGGGLGLGTPPGAAYYRQQALGQLQWHYGKAMPPSQSSLPGSPAERRGSPRHRLAECPPQGTTARAAGGGGGKAGQRRGGRDALLQRLCFWSSVAPGCRCMRRPEDHARPPCAAAPLRRCAGACLAPSLPCCKAAPHSDPNEAPLPHWLRQRACCRAHRSASIPQGAARAATTLYPDHENTYTPSKPSALCHYIPIESQGPL